MSEATKIRQLASNLSTASVVSDEITITAEDARLWSRSLDSISEIMDRDADFYSASLMHRNRIDRISIWDNALLKVCVSTWIVAAFAQIVGGLT